MYRVLEATVAYATLICTFYYYYYYYYYLSQVFGPHLEPKHPTTNILLMGRRLALWERRVWMANKSSEAKNKVIRRPYYFSSSSCCGSRVVIVVVVEVIINAFMNS